MANPLTNEPVATSAIAVGIVNAVASLVTLSDGEKGILVAVVTGLLPVIGGLLARAAVTPVGKQILRDVKAAEPVVQAVADATKPEAD